MPSSNKRFSRSLVTSGSRSIEECHCWLAPSAPHYSTTRIIPRVAQRDAKEKEKGFADTFEAGLGFVQKSIGGV